MPYLRLHRPDRQGRGRLRLDRNPRRHAVVVGLPGRLLRGGHRRVFLHGVPDPWCASSRLMGRPGSLRSPDRRDVAHPPMEFRAISAPALLRSRAGPGGVPPLLVVSASMDFLIDEAEELAGRSWSSEFLDLPQRVAQLHKVFSRQQGPPSGGVWNRVPRAGPPGHAASFAARSWRRYPWRYP